MKEKLKHIEALEYLYSLGGNTTDENVSKTSVKCQVSERTFWRWYKKYNWKERVEQRNINNAKKLEDKTDKTIVNTKADYRAEIKTQLSILKAILNKVIQDFKNNNIINVNTINELEKVVSSYEKLCKLDLSIMGENLDKQEVIINILGEANENNN